MRDFTVRRREYLAKALRAMPGVQNVSQQVAGRVRDIVVASAPVGRTGRFKASIGVAHVGNPASLGGANRLVRGPVDVVYSTDPQAAIIEYGTTHPDGPQTGPHWTFTRAVKRSRGLI